MTFLAVGVAIHAMRYDAVPANIYLGIDSAIRGVIARVPVQALTHMIVGPIALLAGPLQFFAGLRARRPPLHRRARRTSVAACMISRVRRAVYAPYSTRGPLPAI